MDGGKGKSTLREREEERGERRENNMQIGKGLVAAAAKKKQN